MDKARPIRSLCVISAKRVGGQSVRTAGVYGLLGEHGIDPRVGVYSSAQEVSDYFIERGFEPLMLDAHAFTDPRKFMEFARYLVGLPAGIVRVARMLSHNDIDLVHANGAFDILTALAARLSGTRLVWHLNDTTFPALPSRALGLLVRLLAHRIVVAATRVGEHYGIPTRRYCLLFAPVDTARFRPRNADYLPGNTLRIGMVGNWNWIKGQDRFINVISALGELGVDAKGYIVGSLLESQVKWWQPILEKIEASDLADNITALGFSDDVAAQVAQFDVVLLPSRSEACPICVLEAMAVGVPVVAFDVGGVREMLGDGDAAAGVVVDKGDVAAMATAITHLLAEPALYKRMAANGRSRAHDIFSLEACVERHKLTYHEALGIMG